ncbi:MAG: hypothetical protein HQM16_07735 [Deltaproteobacteria bacterium]|nr:hypothetical protein [Deltaproteobacteria bacterium]
MNLILKLLFVGVSLQAYYFYSLKMPAISVFSLFLMAALLLAGSAQKGIALIWTQSFALAMVYVLLLFWAYTGLIYYQDAPDMKRLIGFIIVILACLISLSLMRFVSLEDLLKFYLIIHLSFFMVQFLVYHTTGYDIDFLTPVTGEEQRMSTGDFGFYGRFIRAAGLFNEPGTYAIFVAPVVALFQRYYAQSKSNKWLFWIGTFTLFASFSTYGLISGAIILVLFDKVKKVYRVWISVLFVSLLAPYLHFRYVQLPQHGEVTGIDLRGNFIGKSWEFLFSDFYKFSFGADLMSLTSRIDVPGFAYNDIGLLYFLCHFAGVPLTLLLLVVLVYFMFVKFDRASSVSLLIILLSKHSIFAPFFPFFITMIFWKEHYGEGKKIICDAT